MFLQHIPKPQVPMENASKRTISTRCKAVESMRMTITGGGDCGKLLHAQEIRRMPPVEQDQVLRAAGVQHARPPPNFGLQLKIGLGLTGSQWGKLQRYN
jgi:hypothetical protein